MNFVFLLFVLFFGVHHSSYSMELVKYYMPSVYIGAKCLFNRKLDQDIYHAAETGNLHFLQTAVEYHEKRTLSLNFNFIDLQSGQTPLTIVIQKNHYPVLTFLLNHGADANFKNKNKTVPIRYALACNNLFAVGALLHQNATLNDKDSDGNSIFDYLISNAGYSSSQKKEIVEHFTKTKSFKHFIEYVFEKETTDNLYMLAPLSEFYDNIQKQLTIEQKRIGSCPE